MSLRTRDEQLLSLGNNKNEEQQIGRLAIRLATFLFLVVFGAVGIWFGYVLCRYDWQATSAPLEINLDDVESGEIPSSTFVTIGPHIAMHPVRIDGCYPIFSIEGTSLGDYVNTRVGNELDREVQQLSYRLRKCRYLVMAGVRKKRIIFDEPVTGMVICRASDLDFLDAKFSNLNIEDPDNVMVIQVGREPNVWPGTMVIFVGVALLVGAGYSVIGLLSSLKEFGYD